MLLNVLRPSAESAVDPVVLVVANMILIGCVLMRKEAAAARVPDKDELQYIRTQPFRHRLKEVKRHVGIKQKIG
jgi:hypothetical protein